jgi:predicted transcriptional regulator of viral defense system
MVEQEPLLEYVRKNGVTRARELTAQGFHSQEITRCVRIGEIDRLRRGLYAVPQLDLSSWHDFAEISKKTPAVVVNLISALAFHQIGTQLPHETWIALPKGTWKPRTDRPIRVTYLSEPYYSSGIEEHDIEGARVRVYCAAKTVADCFRMRSKVGYGVAVEALREGWRSRKFDTEELARFAKINRVWQVMYPYIEAIVS